jgi:MFS family permease
VRRAGTTLDRAVSAYDGVSRGARMLGAPVAGVLIAVASPTDVLLVDAGTFLFSALVVRLVVPALAVRVRAPAHWLTELREGMSFIRHHRLVLAVVTMVMVTNMLDAAMGSVLQIVYAKQVLGSSVALGLMAAVFGGCAMAGTVLYAALAPRLPRRAVYTIAFLAAGSPRFFVMAFTDRLWAVLAVLAVGGFLCGAINPIIGALQYELVPEQLQGRVFGAITAGCYAAIPIGALMAGYLVAVVGLRTSLVLVGGAYLVTTCAPIVFPVWRGMDARRGVGTNELTAA